MPQDTKLASCYFPLYRVEDPRTAEFAPDGTQTKVGNSRLAAMLNFENPGEGYTLAEAITLVLVGEADAVGDASSQVLYDRARCGRLLDLAYLLEGKNNIPADLLDQRRWVGWRAVWDESKQKFRKPPCSALTGEGIGAVEKYLPHFTAFDTALLGAEKFLLDGIGFVFMPGDNFVGIDFDNCIDEQGNIHPAVQYWLKWFPDTYVELSPSGTGLHVICRGTLAKALAATPLPNAPSVTVEAYSHGRYFTVTGRRIGQATQVADCQASVDKLLAHVGQPAPSASDSKPKTETLLSPHQVRRIYTEQLTKLREIHQGAGNTELNNTALIAARVCASGVFDKTAEQFKQELLRIVTYEWKDPHPEHSAWQTIESGWRKGASEGSYNIRKCVLAVSSADYCAETPKEMPYIVNGMIFQGTASQMMGPIKDGKTTWLLTLTRKTLCGEDFIGQKTTPTNILYVTEQPRPSFQAQLARSGLDRTALLEKRLANLYVLDLGHLWNLNWEGRADTIRENADKLDVGLVIIDTFPRIALVEEIQNAGEMNQRFETIAPLVVADKRALLMAWHERKAGGSISEAAAGTVASGGAVDMLLRLRRAQGAKLNDRTRQLELLGRFPSAFEEAVAIELNNDMSNYKLLGTKKAAARRNSEEQILNLLPPESPGLTRDEIMEALRGEAQEQDVKPPSESTALRALNKLVEVGVVEQTGTGTAGKNMEADPFRYCKKEPPF